MTGKVLQINVSRGGVPKRPIGDGELTERGFTGDSWAHPQFHGGPDKAVLLMAVETVSRLKEEGFPVYPGALGENVTTEGLKPAEWRSGQRFRLGDAEVELTEIRVPCSTLHVYGTSVKAALYDAAVKRGDTGSPLWAQSGFYAKVLRSGLVFPGSPIVLMSEWA